MAKPIIIDNFQKGIAQSPHVGFGDMRALDISTVAGVAKPQFTLAKTSASIVTGDESVTSIAYDEVNGIYYALTQAGVVYQSTNSGVTWTAVTTTDYTAYVNGSLVVWKDYLIVIGGNGTSPDYTRTMQFYGPLKTLTALSIDCAFVDSNPDTITNSGNTFVAVGFKPGMSITVTDSADNNDTFTIAAAGVAAGTLTLIAGDTLTAEGENTVTISTAPRWSDTPVTGGNIASEEQIALIVGQDDIIYYGGGRRIGSFKEVSGSTFDAETSATYTNNATALDLPNNVNCSFIGELGSNLMLGTSTRTTADPEAFANIYPWDRTSQSFNIPLRIQDFACRAAITVGRKMYFFTGSKGRLWVTNGVDVQQVAELPDHLFDFDSDPTKQVTINQTSLTYVDGKILFGVGGIDDYDAYPVGIWSYSLKTGAMTFEHELSIASSTTPDIGVIHPLFNGQILVGWDDGTNAGIDISSTSAVETSYGSYLISKLFYVGTRFAKRPIKQVDVVMAKELAAGDAIQIDYRENLTDGWTNVMYIEHTASAGTKSYGADHIFSEMVNLNVATVQFKISLTTSGTSIPQLREIRFN